MLISAAVPPPFSICATESTIFSDYNYYFWSLQPIKHLLTPYYYKIFKPFQTSPLLLQSFVLYSTFLLKLSVLRSEGGFGKSNIVVCSFFTWWEAKQRASATSFFTYPSELCFTIMVCAHPRYNNGIHMQRAPSLLSKTYYVIKFIQIVLFCWNTMVLSLKWYISSHVSPDLFQHESSSILPLLISYPTRGWATTTIRLVDSSSHLEYWYIHCNVTSTGKNQDISWIETHMDEHKKHRQTQAATKE